MNNNKPLSESEIDELVIAEADDGSAWEEPIVVNGGLRKFAFSELDSVVLPKRLLDHARKLATGEGVSLNQFVTSAVAEKVSISGHQYLKNRAKRASREKFLEALSKVPNVEPDPWDKLD